MSKSISTTLTRPRIISTSTYALPGVRQTITTTSSTTRPPITLLSASIHTTSTTARIAGRTSQSGLLPLTLGFNDSGNRTSLNTSALYLVKLQQQLQAG